MSEKRCILRRRGIAALLSVALAAAAMPAGAAVPDIDGLAGVYRTHSLQARMDGTEYAAENILEIIELTPSTAYFRTRVVGANGHECDLFGVAELDLDSLVYRPAKPFLNGVPSCRFSIRMNGGRLVLDDRDEGCQSACGVRASCNDGIFPRTARGPIHYLSRLLQSTEYRQALAEYRLRPGGTTP